MLVNFKSEILAPAGRTGDIVPLLEAGADAIYVGLSGCSARPESSDFSLDEIEQSLEAVHSAGKKMFIAVNANIKSEKINDLCDAVVKLDKMHVDALIVSDYGIMNRLCAMGLNCEIHASTLAGIYNYEDVIMLKAMGIKRIILSSDLFVDEIADIIEHVPDMDYEIVADGGICFNSNRQCLLPHFGQKEGFNVFCQKSYHIEKDGKFISKAKRIGNCPGKIHRTMGIYLGLGIYSFKIEGRTNSLDYILKRVKDMAESKDFYSSHADEILGMMHYICRNNLMGDK